MSDLFAKITALLGADQVMPWEALPLAQQFPIQGALATAMPPAAIAYPQTQEELAEVMVCAHQQRWRILACGYGSKLPWGGLVQGIDLVISTQRLNRLIEHAVGDLTVTAEAGMPLAQLQQILAAQQQFLAVDPAYPDQATLGGMVATGDTGSLRQRYGGIRDMLIGLSLVRHDGQIAKAGGRVVKNVAGYDLMKLMTGSYGTLGIVSQVTFRTYPIQSASQTVVFSGSGDALQKLAAALRRSPLTPITCDGLSPALMAHLGQPRAVGLAARFQSIAAGVEEQVQRLLQLGQELGLAGSTLTGEADLQFWRQSSAALWGVGSGNEEASSQTAGEALATAGAIAKLGILPESAVGLLERVESLAAAPARIHLGSGIGILRLAGASDLMDGLLKVRSHCEQTGGYLTVLAAPRALKQTIDIWGYTGNAQDLMRRLKHQFDPQQLLSPGRL